MATQDMQCLARFCCPHNRVSISAGRCQQPAIRAIGNVVDHPTVHRPGKEFMIRGEVPYLCRSIVAGRDHRCSVSIEGKPQNAVRVTTEREQLLACSRVEHNASDCQACSIRAVGDGLNLRSGSASGQRQHNLSGLNIPDLDIGAAATCCHVPSIGTESEAYDIVFMLTGEPFATGGDIYDFYDPKVCKCGNVCPIGTEYAHIGLTGRGRQLEQFSVRTGLPDDLLIDTVGGQQVSIRAVRCAENLTAVSREAPPFLA